MSLTNSDSSHGQLLGSSIALGLIVHQVFRKYETFNAAVNTSLVALPPIFLSLFVCPSQRAVFHGLLVSAGTYIMTLIVSVIIYRLSPLHPLSQYPGPTGCKITKLWMAFVSVPGFQHQYIKSLHDQYGDAVRIGPNELSIRDSSALSALLGHSGASKGPQIMGRVLSDIKLPLIGIMNTEEHLRRRKSWSRGMGPAAIKEYEHSIVYRARQLLEGLEGCVGEKDFVIGNWFSYFSFDFMSDMAFGGGSDLLSAGHDAGNIWTILEEFMQIGTFFSHVPWLAVLIGKIPTATGNLNVLLNKSEELVKGRLKRGSERKDLFHYLNNEDLPDQAPPPLHHLIDDGVLVIVAGADTTSTALTNLLYCILTHPDAYEKLQAEIDKFYPLGEDALDPKHYRDMHYLTAVINETLRVLSPAPGGTQRQVPPYGDGLRAGNIILPPGTVFWAHAYSIHHDVHNFSPYTSEFWPERWLLASGDVASSRGVTAASPDFRHNEAGYLPFSMGPMNCVGKALALQELRMVTCALLQKFTVRMKAGWDPRTYERNYKDYLTSPRSELPVTLEVRH